MSTQGPDVVLSRVYRAEFTTTPVRVDRFSVGVSSWTGLARLKTDEFQELIDMTDHWQLRVLS